MRSLDFELKKYNSKYPKDSELPLCISDKLLPATFRNFEDFDRIVVNKGKVENSREALLLAAFSRILPWAIIMEWVCSVEFESQKRIPIHFSQVFFHRMKLSYEKFNYEVLKEEDPDYLKGTWPQ
ncbi:hypothetical protein HMI55_005989, partial [Coelomomyces lativittatus]